MSYTIRFEHNPGVGVMVELPDEGIRGAIADAAPEPEFHPGAISWVLLALFFGGALIAHKKWGQ